MYRILLLVAFLLSPSTAICPSQCKCTLDTTDCSNQMLTSIPSEIENVNYLNLSHNKIPSFVLPTSLQNLHYVDLSHNNIQIANFPRLDNLQEINLSWNELTAVMVENLPKLKKLNISHNDHFRLGHQLSSRSLSYLDLSNTSLINIDLNENLSNLTTLILANNPISSITHLRLKTLQILDVSNCTINHIGVKDLKSLSALRELIARDNKNLDISFSEIQVVNLEFADFSNGGVQKIHISALKKITNLNLSFNKIKSIGDSSFESNSNLSLLKIASNNIKEITNKAFRNNLLMTYIDVSNNSVYSMKWTQTLSVKYFNASHNKIQSLSDLKLKNATIIDISYNLIGSISIELSVLPQVEFLNLGHNLIEQIIPLKSKTLERLLLGYCKISVLNLQTFAGLPELQFLDLEGNQLKKLDYLVLAQATSLRHVLLGHNSWICDCANVKFRNLFFYLIVNKTLTDQNTLICDEGKLWTEVCIQPMNHKLETKFDSNVFVWLGVFFLVALAAGLGLLYCKGRKTPPLPETPPPVAVHHHPLLRNSMRRAHSAAEILLHRATPESPPYQDNPPPYDEAILLPPLTETERMTRSMEVFLDRSN